MRMTGKNHSLKTARIKDVAELDPETLGESTDPNFSFKYIDLSAVKGGRIGDQVESMTFAGAPGRARKLIKEGDVLLGMVRPYLKPFAKVQRALGVHVASTGFAVIRARSGVTDPEYLYQTIWSDGISKQIHQMVTGSSYPALSVGDVKDLKIPLPPLAEQRKIAEILRTWDEAIETAEAELKAKQTLHQGLLQRAFSQGECIAAGGGKPLGEVVTLVKGKKPELYNEQFNGAAPYLVARFIRGEEAPKFAAQSDKNAVRVVASDIVIICDGSNSGEMFTGLDGVLSSTMAKLIPVSSDFEKAYIRYFVGYNGLRLSEAQEGGAIPHLDREKLLNFRIPMLEKKEQEVVVERLNASERAVQFVKQRTELLRTQKRGLMQKLLTGEVRVAV